MKKKFVLFIICVSVVINATAQAPAPPGEIFARTLLIKVGNEEGTAFTLDHGGKTYLITARHIVVGVPLQNAVIQIWQTDHWLDYPTVKTLFPSSQQVDIAVFETNEKAQAPTNGMLHVTPLDKDSKQGAIFGQQVYFLGYPFAMSSTMHTNHADPAFTNSPEIIKLPFIKSGTLSAMDGSDPDAVLIYIDGFNNPGFSGGPIIFWSFTEQRYKIFGVIKGYTNQNAKMIVNGQQVDTPILVNSGILIGYSIQHALDAIEKNEALEAAEQ